LCITGFVAQVWVVREIAPSHNWPFSWIYAILHWPSAVTQQIALLVGIAILVWIAGVTRGYREIPSPYSNAVSGVLGYCGLCLLPLLAALVCFALVILVYIIVGIASLAIVALIAIGIAGGFG
jgi:hypothetical protein